MLKHAISSERNLASLLAASASQLRTVGAGGLAQSLWAAIL